MNGSETRRIQKNGSDADVHAITNALDESDGST
jgi:hypothetical protein